MELTFEEYQDLKKLDDGSDTKHKKSDVFDTQYKIKKFLKVIYRGIDFEEESIRVFQQSENYSRVHFFNDIDDVVKFSSNKYTKWNNTYFTLSTTNGLGGKDEDLMYRYCLGFDFDKKTLGADFNHKDIVNKFKELKIYCHCIIDSGNGYHAYVMLNRTNKLHLVNDVQRELAIKLNADMNAIKPSQILRIPLTFNVKDKPKLVRIVHLADRHSKDFRPYDIEFLHKKNCDNRYAAGNDYKKIKYVLNNTNVPKCIQNILEHGSQAGDRYKDLCNIVVALRLRNKSYSDIVEVCKEWALKSEYDDNLEYRIEHIYNNKLSLELNCSECEHQEECYSKVVSDFEYSENDIILKVDETTMQRLKKSTRKGVKVMKPNDLLVYGVLKNNVGGLNIDEILKELTYTKKKKVVNVALSERTLKNTLKSLLENGFISVEKGVKRLGIKDRYIVNESRSKVELTYNVSYGATYECVKGNISSEELRLYNYIRYLHHKEQRENPESLKGNLFQINQSVLAEHLGVTQGRISQMIENLVDEKIMGIWYKQASKNNGFEYNIYRLIY